MKHISLSWIACAAVGGGAPLLAASADLSITDPMHTPRASLVSPGVIVGPTAARAGMNLAAMSLTASDLDVLTVNDDDAGESANHKGERVPAAPVRFQEDFESGEIGPEWSMFGATLRHDDLTTFADPSQPGGMVLNVKTESDEAYEVRVDIYLLPPSGDAAADEENNILRILIDGQPAHEFSPAALAKLAGKAAVPGRPFVRRLHIPFTAAHRIAEIRFESPSEAPSGWSRWGIDNLVIDLGLQDPVFGVTGGGGDYDPGLLGLPDPNAGLTGELPAMPGSRYGSNEPFSGGGGGGGGGNDPFDPIPEPPDEPEDPLDPDEPSDPDDPPPPPGDPDDPDRPTPPGDETPPERPIPSVPTALIFAAAAWRFTQRGR